MSRAVVSEGVVDIFAAAGLKKPDITILSDEFLAEVRAMPQRNLALELLRKLLDDAMRSRARRNVVEADRSPRSSKARSASTRTARWKPRMSSIS